MVPRPHIKIRRKPNSRDLPWEEDEDDQELEYAYAGMLYARSWYTE